MTDFEKLKQLINNRVTHILIISLSSMLLCQFVKFVFVSIANKKLRWDCLITTGGFPSSHSALCVSLCTTMAMFQFHDLGSLDWSFAVAVIFSVIIIHDAMGVRLEASKHAKILNNLVENKTQEEKQELGFGEKGTLKEMLGHKGVEVLGGIICGLVFGVIGYFIFV